MSFGAQSLVKDVISGFFILFENQFAIGDVIEVAGKSGVVEKMTLRVVVLRDGEGIMHVVPNSEIKVVSNKTRGWSRAVVDVGVPYDENVDRALEVLRDEAAQFSTDKTWGSQLDGPVEVLGVESLSDSAVVLRTHDPHPAGLAVDRGPRVPPADQEPVRPGEARDSVPAAPRARARRRRPGGHRSGRPRRGRGGGRMTLRLYNTLTRQIEPFVPLQPGRVTLYTCGPTVYNYAHIGNFRTFLFEDLLRRWLEASGYEVFHIMNLTDVDDKTIGGAVAAGQPLREYVQQYIDAFHEDRRYLRIADASIYPRATDYIAPMIALIEGLLAKGVAYRGEDGSVYFAIARFPAYGRLSQLDRRELKAGASERVSDDEYAKEDVRDFALWKAARRRTKRSARPGTRRSAEGGRAGTSSARRWRSS